MNDIISPFIPVFLYEYFEEIDHGKLELPENFNEKFTAEMELNVPAFFPPKKQTFSRWKRMLITALTDS
jgi:hypothetical protein